MTITRPDPQLSAAAVASPGICRLRLGEQLRRLREARSLRLGDVAATVGVDPSTLSRIETGRAPARTCYVLTMLDRYGVDDPDQRRLLADLAREGQRKGWWTDYADLLPAGAGTYLSLETAAAGICTYTAHTIPALLQAPGYAAAAHHATWPDLTAGQVARLAAITLRRQDILRRDGFRLHAVLDEAALLRTIGSAAVMAAQLSHLAAAAASGQVTVQITRLAAAQPVLSPPFTLLTFAGPAGPGLACTSGGRGETVITKDDSHVRATRRTFTALACAALSPASSARLIRELAAPPAQPGSQP